MADLPLDQVPREGEIVEVLYRRSGAAQTHLDVTVSVDGVVRHLRFHGARVVQFQEEQPEVLQGIDVQDIRDQQLGDLTLWVSIAEGAITFWAKAIVEMTQPKPEVRPAPREQGAPEEIPLLAADQVRAWGPNGTLPSSFRYRALGSGGSLRGFSVGTRPFS